MFYIYLYFLLSCFLTGYIIGSESYIMWRTWKDVTSNVFLAVMFLTLSPVLYLAEGLKKAGKWLAHETDLLFQIKFYWMYFRGGFYNMDDQRLKNADIHVFKLEYNGKNALKYRHLRYVYNLIFERNNYTRRKWKVVNGLVEEYK